MVTVPIGAPIDPQDLLDYARAHPESELHALIEWDDAVAAEKWRLATAKRLSRDYRRES